MNTISKTALVLLISFNMNSVNGLATEFTAAANAADNAVTMAKEVEQLEELLKLMKDSKNNIKRLLGNNGTQDEVLQELLGLTDTVSVLNSLSYKNKNYLEYEELQFNGREDIPTELTKMKKRYTDWTTHTHNIIRNTINGAGVQASLFNQETARIELLRSKTGSAVGRKQVLEAGNYIASEMVGQVQKLRQIMLSDQQFKANIEIQKESKNQEGVASMLDYTKDNPALKTRNTNTFDPFTAMESR